MAAQVQTDAKIYAKLEKLLKPYDKVTKNPSSDFLTWFLETIYRLDDIEARDAICDKKDDAGIDAVVVDEQAKAIVVFQAKRREANKTLGDTDLKHFVGSIKQFQSKKSVEQLLQSGTVDAALKDRLKDLDVAAKVDDGYVIQALFITNVAATQHAHDYLSKVAQSENLELWDLVRLKPILRQLDHEWFITEPTSLYADQSIMQFGSAAKPDLVFAAIKAKELIKLPGIEDTRLFAQNVRLGLGNTRVNKEIVSSIQDSSEHKNFLTFHNGLTIVAKEIVVKANKITLNDFSVCNGCQSLLSFSKNKDKLTNALAVLVRVVRVGDGRESAATIAHRTNNQNAISLRDLNSNDSTQVILAGQYNKLFGKHCKYLIKRGEEAKAGEFSNELAGRLLLSIYVREPWSAHQKYRIFGDLESTIFSYKVDAARIRLAQLIDEKVIEYVKKIEQPQIARYGLTRFIFCYFVAELLRVSSAGSELLQDSINYLRATKANPKEEKVLKQIESLCDFVLLELNYFFNDKENENYNYKSNFKIAQPVNSLRDQIAKSYEKDLKRKKQDAFRLPG